MESRNVLKYEDANLLNDDIYYNILINTDANDVLNLCQSNKQLDRLCDDNFWKNKLAADYPIVKIKSKNYKKEYHRLTILYQLAENLLKVIQLYAKDYNTTTISFLDEDDNGFSNLNRMYWLPEYIKKEIPKAHRVRMIISDDYYINLVKTITNVDIKIKTDKQTVINTFWLLMYHYNLNITDLHGFPFLYERLLDINYTSMGKIRLQYWHSVLNI